MNKFPTSNSSGSYDTCTQESTVLSGDSTSIRELEEIVAELRSLVAERSYKIVQYKVVIDTLSTEVAELRKGLAETREVLDTTVKRLESLYDLGAV